MQDLQSLAREDNVMRGSVKDEKDLAWIPSQIPSGCYLLAAHGYEEYYLTFADAVDKTLPSHWECVY